MTCYGLDWVPSGPTRESDASPSFEGVILPELSISTIPYIQSVGRICFMFQLPRRQAHVVRQRGCVLGNDWTQQVESTTV